MPLVKGLLRLLVGCSWEILQNGFQSTQDLNLTTLGVGAVARRPTTESTSSGTHLGKWIAEHTQWISAKWNESVLISICYILLLIIHLNCKSSRKDYWILGGSWSMIACKPRTFYHPLKRNMAPEHLGSVTFQGCLLKKVKVKNKDIPRAQNHGGSTGHSWRSSVSTSKVQQFP